MRVGGKVLNTSQGYSLVASMYELRRDAIGDYYLIRAKCAVARQVALSLFLTLDVYLARRTRLTCQLARTLYSNYA